MKKYLGFVVCLALLLAPVICVTGLQASENSLQGMVVQISSQLVIVAEQQEDGMRISEVDIEIAPDTQYEKDQTHESFKEGDIIKIEYRQEESKKVAVLIEKVNFSEI